jgi:chromosome partitioning protein
MISWRGPESISNRSADGRDQTGTDLSKDTPTVSFVSQKGGVGKSTLARLMAVGAAHRGKRTLLADFDLEQLTCVEWNALRLKHAVEPDIDARAFKSLKKLRKSEDSVDFIVVDTRGLADTLSLEVAEDSDVVFLPTGTSSDDLRPTLALARKLAKHGADGRLVLVLSKVGRSETQLAKATETIAASGFELLDEHWPLRDGFQADLDVGRAGREARNPFLRETAERMEEALFRRVAKAKPRG